MRRVPTAALFAITVLAGTALVLSSCGAPSETPSAATSASSKDASETTAEQPGVLPLHVSTVQVKGDEKAVITTSRGVIELTFLTDKALNTVASFIELAEQGFYDGLKFHRVEPGLLIQGGDPFSKTDDPLTGRGDPGWRLKAEFSDAKHVEGTVAMARYEDPDSAGSQFYIGMVPMPRLDGQFTVIGQVVKGMDVVRSIQVGDVIISIRIVHGS